MSTRGIYGFVLNGQEKLTYNHSDSYPEWLGNETLNFLNRDNLSLETLAEKVENLKLVIDDEKPTEEEIEKLKEYANIDVGLGSTEDWYCLLRECQGDWDKTLESGYIIDSHDFAQDSLFCEWGYVVNLDTGFLEVYEGFQKEPHSEGRFADRVNPEAAAAGYYPIKLVAAFSLRELPITEEFLASCHSDDNVGAEA
jgi:hypothetical protein